MDGTAPEMAMNNHKGNNHKIKKETIHLLIEKLLEELEEEDIGISLFTTQYQDNAELDFFKPHDRERVRKILKRLSDDSKRHKKILEKIVNRLEQKINEN